MRKKPVLIAAGGTGGHVFPALAVANELASQSIPVVWVGTEQGIESTVVPKSGIDLRKIRVTGLRGRGVLSRVAGIRNLFSALFRSLLIVHRESPRAVLGMGGYVSGPVCLAARLRGMRVVLHEQNAVAGLTNRLLSRVASRVMEAMPGAFGQRRSVVHTGNPVRREILAVAPPAERFAARNDNCRLLIIGGSQGANALNKLVPEAIGHVDQALHIRHQCGKRWLENTQNAYRGSQHRVDVETFIDDMAEAYGWADLVICRAGAMTVAELSAVGVAAVLIPFPAAVDDHQTANGNHLVKAGAAVMLSESAITVQILADQISALIKDKALLLQMAQNARDNAKRDATDRVVSELLANVTEHTV